MATCGGGALMSSDSRIELRHVSRSFGGQIAVDDLSFSVAGGEIVALVGRTGAGKSTAMNLVMGTIEPDAGTVTVAGVNPYRDFQRLRSKLAVSFQTDRLLPWRTTLENTLLGLQILRLPAAEARSRAADWLARVKMIGAEGKYPHELSGGMRQRVSLARALAVDPEILLLDESFSQLDHITSQELRRDVSHLIRSVRKTCLFITHRIDDAIEMADRIIVLKAPARVALEVAPTARQRNDPEQTKSLHDEIASALSGDELVRA
jgi:NitT/TauT family transport system ATP-binding protein